MRAFVCVARPFIEIGNQGRFASMHVKFVLEFVAISQCIKK